MIGMHLVACPSPQSSGIMSIFIGLIFELNGIISYVDK